MSKQEYTFSFLRDISSESRRFFLVVVIFTAVGE